MASLAASPLWAGETDNQINLSSNTTLSSEGYFVLSWHITPAENTASFSSSDELLLLQANNESMLQAMPRHKLPMAGAITLSGLDNGNYYFRIDSPQISSNVINVEVKHHSLEKAFTFFATGLLLFCILSACIFIGHKSHRNRAA